MMNLGEKMSDEECNSIVEVGATSKQENIKLFILPVGGGY